MATVYVAILNLYLKENDVVDIMEEKIDGNQQINLVEKATTEE